MPVLHQTTSSRLSNIGSANFTWEVARRAGICSCTRPRPDLHLWHAPLTVLSMTNSQRQPALLVVSMRYITIVLGPGLPQKPGPLGDIGCPEMSLHQDLPNECLRLVEDTNGFCLSCPMAPFLGQTWREPASSLQHNLHGPRELMQHQMGDCGVCDQHISSQSVPFLLVDSRSLSNTSSREVCQLLTVDVW